MQKLIRGVAIFAAIWSLFPWGLTALMFLLSAVFPDPGTPIWGKAPWWAVIVVLIAEPVLWLLLWTAQKSKGATLLLTAFVGGIIGSTWLMGAPGLMILWLGPTILLLPILFWQHWRMRTAAG